MFKSTNTRKRELDAEERTPWLQDDEEDGLAVAEVCNSKLLSFKNTFALIFILALGIAIGLLTNNSYHNYYAQTQAIDGAEPDLFKGISFPTHLTRSNGSLFHRSKYAGPPNPDLDAAWARYTAIGNEYMPHYPALLSISAHDVEMSSTNPIEAAVEFEGSEGGGYMATLGMYHEIHCLEMLRKFIYFDYYAASDPEWANAPLLREHTDHCLDMLRELLMCRADTTLITYHWRKGFPGPVPDFSTRQMCRDPEDVLRWTRQNEVNIRKEVARPEGIKELEHDF